MLKTRSWPVLLAVVAIALPTCVAGDEIYRWVDEDGVIHFGDNAQGQAGAELVEVQFDTGQGIRVELSPEPEGNDNAPDQQASPAQQQRDERAAKRKEEAERKADTQARCDRARQRAAKLEPSPRVLVRHADGTVERMDDNTRLELLAGAKTYIAENCGE